MPIVYDGPVNWCSTRGSVTVPAGASGRTRPLPAPLVAFRAPMRMRQSFHQFEAAFRESLVEERSLSERRLEAAAKRAHQRRQQKVRKHATLRYVALVASIIGTSVLVTFVMFETLAWLIGG